MRASVVGDSAKACSLQPARSVDHLRPYGSKSMEQHDRRPLPTYIARETRPVRSHACFPKTRRSQPSEQACDRLFEVVDVVVGQPEQWNVLISDHTGAVYHEHRAPDESTGPEGTVGLRDRLVWI